MSEGKDLKFALLLDFYGDLLTENQRNVIDHYYNDDLSLGEIAEQENISRQGVRDSIKRGEQTLSELENALGVAAKSAELTAVADELELLSGKESVTASDLKKLSQKIRDIIQG